MRYFICIIYLFHSGYHGLSLTKLYYRKKALIKLKKAHLCQTELLSELWGEFLVRSYESHMSNIRCWFWVVSFLFWRCRIPQPSAGDRAPQQEVNLSVSLTEEMGFCRRPGTRPRGEERPASAHRPRLQTQEVLSLNSASLLYSSSTVSSLYSVNICVFFTRKYCIVLI